MEHAVTTVGAYEAKTHLPAILDNVEMGQEYVITRHGRPIARVIPQSRHDEKKIDAAIARMRALRKGTTLGGLSWKDLRDEGRKYL